MKHQANVVICPPCGESVARATKEGQNRKNTLWPLLPRLTAVLPPQGREMFRGFTARFVIPQGRYAGYSGRVGFTLIELLVVVLIIGILAAVAVPQYQKAVERSKTRQAIQLLENVYKAQQVYYLAKGEYARSFADLDIDIPWQNTSSRWSAIAVDTRANELWNIEIAANQWGDMMLYAGRNSGPYKGSGFLKQLTTSDPYTYCVERRADGMIYDASNGSYCQRFFNCTPGSSASTLNRCWSPVH